MDITFLFYDGITALDAIGPLEVLSRLPGARVQCASLIKGDIQSCSGVTFKTDYSLSDIKKTDILVVPGASSATDLSDAPDILQWIRDIDKTTTWTTSVCTGSLILGVAGLLANRKATSHWAVIERLKTWGAIPTHQRVVVSDKIITAAGVSAGVDMALSMAAIVAGQEIAETIQLMIEYDPDPPFHSGSPDKASPHMVKSVRSHYNY